MLHTAKDLVVTAKEDSNCIDGAIDQQSWLTNQFIDWQKDLTEALR